ncbi:hypothetical protein [Pedobacter rhodius]|uniref:Uncharacterized protein n=1 Tax=Pedobacter rhodius TaxID=3004098 RepID=A0ABT4KZT3_9SPHI|nr:hypothetical protein [Pedobacter sp. SJ11]MCZ4224445.1 hypothetical protein [Pedobacter sp. SJ11]
MKTNKLEKKVQFIFKRRPAGNLSKQQMQTVKGGNGPQKPTEGPSVDPGCTIVQIPTQTDI